MASKSKKRRRVLGASCILAALIVAGSSFAWFTSRDEVTNRLTANSDYGVSIVESFAPPKNMLPGEIVNKDVYAVNTGSVDAFVKENVTGVLNYTYEKTVDSFATTNMKLNINEVKAIQGTAANTPGSEDGITTYEAGGFLAWTDAKTTATVTTTTTTYKFGDEDVDDPDTYFDDISAAPVTADISGESTTFNYKKGDYYGTAKTGDSVTFYKLTESGGVYTYDDSAADATKTFTTTTTSQTTTEDTYYEAGSVNTGRTGDKITADWKPTVPGAYVFRRGITHDMTQDGDHPNDNQYTYAGYYFDGTDYYKIVLGNDELRPANKDASGNFVFDIYANETALGLGANDVDRETGTITKDGGITYKFVTEEKVEDTPVTFEFEAATADHPNRLVVDYAFATTTDGTAYDAKATAARAEVDYQNKLGTYDATVQSYNNAVANYEYGKKLAEEEKALYDKLADLRTKYSANETAKTEYETARDNVNKYAQYMEDATGTPSPAISNNGILARSGDTDTSDCNDIQDGSLALKAVSVNDGGIMPDEAMQAYNATPSGNPYVSATALAKYKESFDNYKSIHEEIYGTTGTGGLYGEIQQLLDDIESLSATTATPTDDANGKGDADRAAAKVATLKTKADDLVKKLKALKQAYANFTDDLTLVTGMTLGDNTPAITALNNIITCAENFVTNVGVLEGLVETNADSYVNKEDAYNAAKKAYDTAVDDWKDAVDTYNTNVGNAKKAYNSDDAADNSAKKKLTDANAWDTNNDKHVFEDKSADVVPAYSAVSSTTDSAFTTVQTNALKAFTGQTTGTGADVMPTGVDVRDMTIPGQDADEFKTADVINKYQTTDGTNRDVSAATAQTVTWWAEQVKTTKTAKDNANKVYQDAIAALTSAQKVKLYVNLADNFKNGADAMWYMDPATDKSTDVDFYYKKVLLAGQTTEKLIDSVEFDKDVTPAAYKKLTFDLNVGLDSAQVTYDENQRLYTAKAVEGNDEFGLKVTSPATAFDKDAVLTWS